MDLFEPVWNKIPKETQVMVIRGETSDILLPETIEQMKTSGPGVHKAITIPSVGHAPMLMSAEQTQHVREFFLE